MVMEALVLDKGGLKFTTSIPVPKLEPDEVLIRVKAVGICGTDIAIVNGTLKASLPIIPGHEIAGIVEKVGPVCPQNLIGLAVTTEINTNLCGTCFFCTNGMPTQCPSRKVLGIDINGGMATFVAVRHDLVHALPETLNFREGTFVEPLAAAVQTFELMPMNAQDEYVAILGAGKLGLLILQVLVALDRQAGIERQVLVLDHHAEKLALASRYGASRVLDTSEMADQDLYDDVRAWSAERGPDVVIEAAGSTNSLNQAVYMARPRGKVALKSTHGVPVPFDMTTGVVKEISFHTSRCGPFEKAIDLIRAGSVELEPLISKVYPLARGVEAFKDLSYRKGNAIKYVLEPRQ
jgi:alcohol dehydrogenase